MGFASANTIGFAGFKAKPIEVVCSSEPGLPRFEIDFLSREAATVAQRRISGALGSIGLSLPPRRFKVSLDPSDGITVGPFNDLAIAISILCNIDLVDRETVSEAVIFGSLEADGIIMPGLGTLSGALVANRFGRTLIYPASQASELNDLVGLEAVAVSSLMELIQYFRTGRQSRNQNSRAKPVEHSAGIEDPEL